MRDTTRTPVASKSLAHTTAGSATTPLPLASQSNVYRLVSTTDCFINFGVTAVNDGTNLYLVALVPEYITTSAPSIAAYSVTSNGTLYITNMGAD